MASAPAKITFELKEGVNRVEIALQGADAPLVIDASHAAGGRYSTSDAQEIDALELSPGVKRAAKSDAKAGGEK